MHAMRLKLVGLVASLLVTLSQAGGSADGGWTTTMWSTSTCYVTESCKTQTVSIPGPTVTNTITQTVVTTSVQVQYSTVTQTDTKTVSIPGPTTTIPTTITQVQTKTVSIPGPTITNTITNTVSVPGPTTTNTVTNTVSVPGPTVTNTVTNTVSVPGPTVTNTVTNTVSVPGPITTNTVTNTVSVPGPTTTNTITRTVSVPGPTITNTVTNTVSVPGPTVSVPGPTVTSTVRTTVVQPTTVVQATTATVATTATISRTVTSVNVNTITNTVTRTSVNTVTNTVSTCPTTALTGLVTCTSRIINPTYTTSTPLPTNYHWGCPPGQLCTPPQIGCNWEQNPPAESYYCSPDQCKPAPQLPHITDYNSTWPNPTESTCAWYNPVLGIFHLDPRYFGLSFAIFNVYGQPVCPVASNPPPVGWVDWIKPKPGKPPKLSRRITGPNPLAEILRRQVAAIAPAACYSVFDAASSLGQTIGFVTNRLCPATSEFQAAVGACRACAVANSGTSSTVDDYPSLQPYFNWCNNH